MSAVVVALGPSGAKLARRLVRVLGDAELHGLARRVDDADVLFTDVGPHLRRCFRDGRAIIGVCSSAILIRAIGPVLADKLRERPVLAVAEDGSAVVPLVGGHRGANELARRLGQALAVTAAITTAGDVVLGAALDAPPAGWTLANVDAAKAVMADILAGASVEMSDELDWLDATRFNRAAAGDVRLTAALAPREPGPRELVYHPRRVVVGVGSDRGCPAADLVALVDAAIRDAGVAIATIACVASLERKADEAGVHAVADHLGVPARFLNAAAINAAADRIPNPSSVVMAAVGVAGVAEGAALAASGAPSLAIEKRKSRRATCAIAVSDAIIDPLRVGRARGTLAVVGVGPGTAAWRSREAVELLTRSSDWVGYGRYLDLVSDLRRAQAEHRFALGDEELRVRHALELAGEGRDVALICSGDAGIYAMAALVCELMALPPETSRLSDGAGRVALAFVPGISAFQAAAARAGAPIGHDFCCISLSDLLTPWPVIENRIRAAAVGDFVVAFYNPRSTRRHDQLDRALALIARYRSPETPVIIASNLGRPDETLTYATLTSIETAQVDMLSLVMVGSSTTETCQMGDGRTLVFTPRGYAAKRETAQ